MRVLKSNVAMFFKAMEFYGLKEIPGEKDNPIILDWFKDIGFGYIRNDETAWCGAFINWVALKCGCERSFKLDARSWLKIGKEVINPELGHLVIFWRESRNSWKGHIGLYVGKDENGNIFCLGGNQDNMLNIKLYNKEQLLGYRELRNV